MDRQWVGGWDIRVGGRALKTSNFNYEVEIMLEKTGNPPLLSTTPSHTFRTEHGSLFLVQAGNGNESIVHPSPFQPAIVSCKVSCRPEMAHCLKFLLETDAKEVTERSPMDMMLSAPVNFLLMRHVWVIFSPFPWQPASEM